jgi:hypothetical protein
MIPNVDPTAKAIAKDRSGCVGAMVFWLIIVAFGCVGLVGSNPDNPSGTQKEQEIDAALGILPGLSTTNTAPPPTTPPTIPPVPETEAPVVVVPQQPGGTGNSGGGGGGQQPQQPQQPAGEVCETTGSISVSGGDRGSLGGGGGTYKSTGPSSITFSGYPLCHNYKFTASGSFGSKASGCFQTATGVSFSGGAPNEDITVSVVAAPGSSC